MQARFTKGSLCQPVLTSSFDKIIGFPDKGNLVDLIYLEFNKAFDMGPHGKLLVRLEKMRINRSGESWGWHREHGGIGVGQRMGLGVLRPILAKSPHLRGWEGSFLALPGFLQWHPALRERSIPAELQGGRGTVRGQCWSMDEQLLILILQPRLSPPGHSSALLPRDL